MTDSDSYDPIEAYDELVLKGKAPSPEEFAKKYPDEFDDWGPTQRSGVADGSRVLIRYQSA